MIKSVLIDTDVILDFYFDRQPFSLPASQLLSLCEKGRLQGFITPILISNVYYILRKTASHEKVINGLKLLLTFINVAIIDKSIVLEALNADFKDFEDALQNYSAQNEKEIEVIITRNIKDFKNSKMAVMTPENFLKAFNIADQ